MSEQSVIMREWFDDLLVDLHCVRHTHTYWCDDVWLDSPNLIHHLILPVSVPLHFSLNTFRRTFFIVDQFNERENVCTMAGIYTRETKQMMWLYVETRKKKKQQKKDEIAKRALIIMIIVLLLWLLVG